jgi:hypothetical protein
MTSADIRPPPLVGGGYFPIYRLPSDANPVHVEPDPKVEEKADPDPTS